MRRAQDSRSPDAEALPIPQELYEISRPVGRAEVHMTMTADGLPPQGSHSGLDENIALRPQCSCGAIDAASIKPGMVHRMENLCTQTMNQAQDLLMVVMSDNGNPYARQQHAAIGVPDSWALPSPLDGLDGPATGPAAAHSGMGCRPCRDRLLRAGCGTVPDPYTWPGAYLCCVCASASGHLRLRSSEPSTDLSLRLLEWPEHDPLNPEQPLPATHSGALQRG